MTAPSADQRQHAFEQSVATSLHLWPALTLAVKSGWGGPDSADKRDWFAGVLVDEFPPMPAHLAALASHASKADPDAAADDVPDEEYVETMLQQVMQDEFEVTVEDGSAGEVAAAIIRLWTRCLAGDLAEAEAVVRRWQGTKGKAAPEGLFTRGADPDQEVEGDDWEDDEDDDDDDDEMGEAPALVEAPKEKPPPEVDEDGFTKVTRRKR